MVKTLVVIVPIIYGKKILCVKRSKSSSRPGEWETTAGHVESGESILKAAKREVFEESGLNVTLFPRMFKINIRDGVGIFILAQPVNGKLTLNPKEHQDHRWVAVKDLDNVQPCPPDFAKNIRKLIKMNRVPAERAKKAMVNREGGRLAATATKAVKVGDYLEVFWSENDPDRFIAPFRGKVLQVGKDSIVIKNGRKLDWSNQDNWEVLRIHRKPDKTYEYQQVTPSNSSNLAVILDAPSAQPWEALWRLTLEDTPDYNNFSLGQAPKGIETSFPSEGHSLAYKTMCDLLEDRGLLDSVRVTQGQRDQVVILIDDPSVKTQVLKIIKKNGMKYQEVSADKNLDYDIDNTGTRQEAIVATYVSGASPYGTNTPVNSPQPGQDPKVTLTVEQPKMPAGVQMQQSGQQTKLVGPADKVNDALKTVPGMPSLQPTATGEVIRLARKLPILLKNGRVSEASRVANQIGNLLQNRNIGKKAQGIWSKSELQGLLSQAIASRSTSLIRLAREILSG